MPKPHDWVDYAHLGLELGQFAQLSEISERLDTLTRLSAAQAAAEIERQGRENRREADEERIREFTFQGCQFVSGLRQAHLQTNPRGTLVLTVGLQEQICRYDLRTDRVRSYQDKEAIQRLLDSVADLERDCKSVLSCEDVEAVANCIRYRHEVLELEAATRDYRKRLGADAQHGEPRSFMRVFGPDVPQSGYFFSGENPLTQFVCDRMPKAKPTAEELAQHIDHFTTYGLKFILKHNDYLIVYSKVNPRVSEFGLQAMERTLGLRPETPVIWVNNNNKQMSAAAFFYGQPEGAVTKDVNWNELEARRLSASNVDLNAVVPPPAGKFGKLSVDDYDRMISERQKFIDEVMYGTKTTAARETPSV